MKAIPPVQLNRQKKNVLEIVFGHYLPSTLCMHLPAGSQDMFRVNIRKNPPLIPGFRFSIARLS